MLRGGHVDDTKCQWVFRVPRHAFSRDKKCAELRHPSKAEARVCGNPSLPSSEYRSDYRFVNDRTKDLGKKTDEKPDTMLSLEWRRRKQERGAHVLPQAGLPAFDKRLFLQLKKDGSPHFSKNKSKQATTSHNTLIYSQDDQA